MQSFQDWEPVVFRKKHVKETDKEAVKAALRSGTHETITRSGNREYNDRARKLEADLDPTQDNVKTAPLTKLSLAGRQEMTRVRTEKKLTQVQLAQQLNVRPQIIQDLENGKVIQDTSVLAKVNRILGTKIKFDK